MTSAARAARPASRPDDDDLLLPEEAAQLLRVPVVTLNKWRVRRRADGGLAGPRFIRIEGGRVRYRRSDLRAYIAEAARRA